MTRDAARYRDKARFAGGLFVGEHSAEVMADYIAGPSHVMPTGGTARFASALSVRTFLRFTPVLQFDDKTFVDLAQDAEILARLEGLEGHARAAEFRRRRSIGE
jgi:histidinol dehydrogenase